MYYDFYEPDYREPTTGELVYDEVKDLLLKTIKQEYLEEMDQLRKEIEQLRPFRDDKLRYETKIRELESECKRKIEAADYNAKQMLMRDLFAENKLTAWTAGHRWIEEPKCDKCDIHREIHFKSPSGKDLTEKCSCANATSMYEPEETYLVRFRVDMNAKVKDQFSAYTYDHPLYRYYAPTSHHVAASLNEAKVEFIWDHDSEYGCSRYADDENTPFADLNRYSAIFLDYNRCKSYCDYLNDKNKKETNKK